MELNDDICYRAIETRDARFDGRFFTGVKTTGVYCRPICPAPTPRRRNVTFFRTAAAAQEAGFRPCLRCRPETAPGCGAWRGSSNTASCALSLIELGALDKGSIESLSDRLGVGERQLRRLFRRHIGASPLAVAQTRRILLAKQLIHDTRLTMTEVAMASGFRSVRRFNEAFQKLYGKPPSELRRAAKADFPRGDEVTINLPYRPPYDWAAMLCYLKARAIPGVEAVSGGCYARTIAMGGQCGTIAVQQADGNALCARIRFPKLSMLLIIVERLRRFFDLAADPDAIGAQLGSDPALADMIAARPGLRVPGAWDGFELAIRTILGQQITVVAATGLAGRLVEACGEPFDSAPATDGLTHLFPNPERLARGGLSKLGMPKARAEALASMSCAALHDPQLFDVRPSLEESVAKLRALPGIGEWTAQYIAMRALREPDAFPAGDIGLMRAMALVVGRELSANDLLKRAERWRPWRAYAAHHLWATLNNKQSLSKNN